MIVIYGRTQCEFCNAAQQMCKKWNLEYEYKNIEYVMYLNELFETYGKDIGSESANGLLDCPYIIWHNRYIGHYNDLLKEIENTIGGYGEGAF
jgi:glutaredoxin